MNDFTYFKPKLDAYSSENVTRQVVIASPASEPHFDMSVIQLSYQLELVG